MKPNRILLTTAASLIAAAAQGVPISWTTGATGDATGSWDGATSTFNGQVYTAADDLTIDGAVVKTVTTSGTILTPLSLTVSSTAATTITGTPVGGTLAKTGVGAALTLASANTFGDVSINGGKFILTAVGALGTTGTLTVNSGAASGITGSYGNPGNNFFFDSQIGGSYDFSKNISFGTVGTPTTYGMAMQQGLLATPFTTTLSGNLSGASNITLWLDVRASTTPNFSTWNLTGNNSAFAGTLRLNRGNIQFSSLAAMGTGPLAIQTNGSDGAGTNPSNLTFGFSGTISNPITIRAGSGTATSLNTGANNITVTNLSLTGSNTAGSGSFNKIGSGTLAVTGTLDTLLRANFLADGSTGAATGGNVGVNVRGGTFDISAAAGSSVTFGSLDGTAGATLNLGAKSLTASSGTFAATFTGTNTSLTKTGAGALTLSNANTYSGGTLISQGTIGVGNVGALSSGAVTVSATAAYGAAYVSGGTPFLRSSVTGLNIPHNISLSSTAGYYGLQMGAAAAGGSVEWSGTISGGGAGVILQIDTPTGGDATSTTTLSGTNTFAGQIRLNRGRLVLTNPEAAGSADLFLQTNANAANGNLVFGFSGTFDNNIIIGTTANNTISPGGNDVEVTGSILGTASWTKGGLGTLRLTGLNTIAGGAVVNAGTLLINGDSSGTGGANTVAVGATLGGTGTLGGATTTVSGTLQGGAGTTGTTFTTTSNVTLNATSIIQLALGGTGAHSALNFSGSESFDATQDFNFLELGVTPGIYGGILTGVGSDPGTLGDWQILNSGWTGTFSYNSSTQAIDLNLLAVPEPSAALSLLASLGALVGWRRRR